MATQNIKRTFILILYREGKTKTKRKTLWTLVVCFLHLGTLSLPACYPLICLSRHLFFFPPTPTSASVVESRVTKHTSDKTHSRQWSTVYYASGSKRNHFPTRTLMFLRGPVLYTPCYVTGYMLATSLLYMTELYNQ